MHHTTFCGERDNDEFKIRIRAHMLRLRVAALSCVKKLSMEVHNDLR